MNIFYFHLLIKVNYFWSFFLNVFFSLFLILYSQKIRLSLDLLLLWFIIYVLFFIRYYVFFLWQFYLYFRSVFEFRNWLLFFNGCQLFLFWIKNSRLWFLYLHWLLFFRLLIFIISNDIKLHLCWFFYFIFINIGYNWMNNPIFICHLWFCNNHRSTLWILNNSCLFLNNRSIFWISFDIHLISFDLGNVTFFILLDLSFQYFLIPSFIEYSFLLVPFMDNSWLIFKTLIFLCDNSPLFKFIKGFLLTKLIEL